MKKISRKLVWPSHQSPLPNGLYPCRCGCGRVCAKPNQRWFSKDCIQETERTCNWATIKRVIFERDNGKCQICGDAPQEYRKQWFINKTHDKPSMENIPLKYLCCVNSGRTHWWDLDHIIPLCEGGTNAHSNLRVLCHPCHKAETSKLNKRIKTKR